MEKFKELEANINGINDTLYICYYASKDGNNYRTLVENVDRDLFQPQINFEQEDIVDEQEVYDSEMANQRVIQ